MDLDEKDRKILEQLQRDSDQTTSDISEKTHIPVTTVHNRIKKMEERGVITGYTVEVDHKELGRGIKAHLLLNVIYTLPDGTKVQQEDVAERLSRFEEVESTDVVTGSYDIMLQVRVGEIEQLNDFVIDKVRNIDGVGKTQTMVVLSQY